MKFRFDNMDASENAFFSRQLESIRSQIFEIQYPELKAFSLLPVKTDLNPGAEEYTYRVFDRVGEAELSSDYSDAGRSVDIKGFEQTQKIRGIKAHYQYSIQEGRAAQMAGLQLEARKAKAARDTIAVKHDDIGLLGNAPAGMKGLFTLSGTQIYTVPVGGGGGTAWNTKTPDEVVQDMHAMAFQIVSASNSVESPDTMVLPLSRKGQISTTRMGDGSGMTILKHFLETNGLIKRVEFSQKLNANAAWTGARAMAYKNASDKLELLLPVEFEQLPPQWDGYVIKTHCHARTGGVCLYFPGSVIYADGV